MNKVFLIGRLTNDPDIRANETSTICKFTLAVNRIKEGADYISCIAWNKTADLIGKYLHKGNQLAIEGRIQTGSYEKEGKKVYTTDIVESITFIGNNEPVVRSKEQDIVKSDKKDPFEEFGIELTEDDYPF